MTRWQEINQFVTKCNLTLLYGLNACYGRKSSEDEMDFDNIKSFINKTAEFIQNSNDFNHLYSFEFGNEISSKINSDIYAKDYTQVYSIINEKTKLLSDKPWLIGPDCMGHQDKYQWHQQFIAQLYDINNGSQQAVTKKLHRLTYHFYPKCDFLYSPNQTIFDMSCLQNISLYASNYSHLAKITETVAYMGEGAEYSHGGTPNFIIFINYVRY